MHSEPSPSLPQMNTWPAGGNPGLPTHPAFALISGNFLLKSVDAGLTKEGSQEFPRTLPGPRTHAQCQPPAKKLVGPGNRTQSPSLGMLLFHLIFLPRETWVCPVSHL